MLTNFLDLKVHTLSFLWIFLQLPETVWGLRNDTNSEKSAENLKTHESPLLTSVDCAISRKELTRGTPFHGFSNLSTFFGIQNIPESSDGFWKPQK